MGQTAVVCGAGGFIGGHLVNNLLANKVKVVRAVDVKPLDQWYQVTEGVENLSLDLKDKANCMVATEGVSLVFQLAADMGGMGFIENNKALCMLSVLINTHMLHIWGDGKQTRRFMYIDDCVEGTRRIMESEINEPINLGSSELVTINQLVDLAEEIAGVN